MQSLENNANVLLRVNKIYERYTREHCAYLKYVNFKTRTACLSIRFEDRAYGKCMKK